VEALAVSPLNLARKVNIQKMMGHVQHVMKENSLLMVTSRNALTVGLVHMLQIANLLNVSPVHQMKPVKRAPQSALLHVTLVLICLMECVPRVPLGRFLIRRMLNFAKIALETPITLPKVLHQQLTAYRVQKER
jgi:hypothetical protein